MGFNKTYVFTDSNRFKSQRHFTLLLLMTTSNLSDIGSHHTGPIISMHLPSTDVTAFTSKTSKSGGVGLSNFAWNRLAFVFFFSCTKVMRMSFFACNIVSLIMTVRGSNDTQTSSLLLLCYCLDHTSLLLSLPNLIMN